MLRKTLPYHQDHLFNADRLAFVDDGDADDQLLGQSVKALTRLRPQQSMKTLLPHLLRPEAPRRQVVASITACTEIFREKCEQPWQVKLDKLSSCVAQPLRRLFHDTLSSATSPNTQLRQHKVYLSNSDEHLLMVVLQIWTAYPRLLVSTNEIPQAPAERPGQQGEESTFSIADPIQTLRCLAALQDKQYSQDLRRANCSALLQVQPVMEKLAQNPATASQIQECTGLAFCRRVLEAYPNVEEEEEALSILKKWLSSMEPHPTLSGGHLDGGESRDLSLKEVLEIVAYTVLASLTDEVRYGPCLDFLKLASAFASQASSAPGSLERATYTMSEEVGSKVAGRTAQIKRMVRIFTAFTHQSRARDIAWTEVYRRWQDISSIFGFPRPKTETSQGARAAYKEDSRSSETAMTEWVQLSGVLVATLPSHLAAPTLSSGTIAHSTTVLPERFFDGTHDGQNAATFLRSMVSLLSSDHPRMRDAARDQLGSDLNPEHLPILLQHMQRIASSFAESGMLNEPSEIITLFFDQFLTIFTSLVHRIPSKSTLPARVTGQIEMLLLASAHYASKGLPTSARVRLQTKTCRAAQTILGSDVSLEKSFSTDFKRALLDCMLAFTLDPSGVSAIVHDVSDFEVLMT